MKLASWLLTCCLLAVSPVLADEHAAEAQAEEDLGEGGHHGQVTLREVFTGHESLQFWGAVVNFALLVYIIQRMAKKPLADFLSKRRDSIESGILEAAEVKKKAEAAFNEYTERMKTLDRELAKLRQDISQAAERDRQRIVAEAEASVSRLLAETEALIVRQTEQLEAQIRREVVEAAANAAEQAVRQASTPEDQQRLAEAFARELGKVAAAPRGAGRHELGERA